MNNSYTWLHSLMLYWASDWAPWHEGRGPGYIVPGSIELKIVVIDNSNPKKTKTEDQLKKSFQNSEIFRKIQKSEIVNNFFENLGNIFENSHSPILEIFDEFCEDATG